MPSATLWSDLEDDAIRQMYPGRGPHWAGWSDVLPGRSPRAIEQRASALGVRRGKRDEAKALPEMLRPAGGDRPRAMSLRDDDKAVMRMMRDGMAPSEIDRALHLVPGTAHHVVVGVWNWDRRKDGHDGD